MAKKVSPIVIPAVVDTSGVDKGVSDIQSKLKKVGGSAGGFGGGVFFRKNADTSILGDEIHRCITKTKQIGIIS